MRAAVALAVAASCLASCAPITDAPEPAASDPERSQPAARTPKPTASPTPTPSPTPDAACVAVPGPPLAKIEAGAKHGTGMVVTRGSAILSPDCASVYFVAAAFEATGIEPQLGVWATNSVDPSGGIVISADGMASEFTDWPDAATNDAAISPADPSVQAARDCLEPSA